MADKTRISQDLSTGLVFIAFGALTGALSLGYPLGRAARMGPGYFPLLLGILLALLGLALVVKGLARGGGEGLGTFAPWRLVRLLASIAAFALLLAPLGLVGASVVTVLVASWAGPEFRPVEALVSAIVLAVSSWLLFVVALKQTMPVWPAFLGS